MEVHHHPHVAKKNFKEYFLEFIMIFLAVTLGFFAESFRTAVEETRKEKEYIKSLKEDVASDTASLKSILAGANEQYQKLDSLTELLKLAMDHKPYDLHRLYYLNFRYSFGLILYGQNERTTSQIKNTGSYAVITNKACRDSIALYDQFNEGVIKNESHDVEDWMSDANKMAQDIFDFYHIRRFGFEGGAEKLLDPNLDLKPIKQDSQLLQKYLNKIRALMMMLDNHLIMEKYQLENAVVLINLLERSY